jgi:hypothetical protein
MNSTTQKSLTDVTDRELCTSLAGDVCPACGGFKKPHHTLCGAEYFKLPNAMRKALYNRLGEGYREAIDAALRKLNGDDSFWLVPRPAAPRGTPARPNE